MIIQFATRIFMTPSKHMIHKELEFCADALRLAREMHTVRWGESLSLGTLKGRGYEL